MSMHADYARFRDEFAKGIDQRFYTIDYLDWVVMCGRAVVFASERAAIVCEIKIYPSGAHVVEGLVEAGDPEEAKTVLIPQAEAWGKAHGCAYGMISSRAGWQRKMKGSGYEPFQTSIVKEL